MKIKDKTRFIYGVATLIFAIIILGTLLFNYQVRFIIGGILLLILSAISFYMAFNKNEKEDIQEFIDERDVFIVRKTSQTSMKIINHIFFLGGLFTILIYGITKIFSFIVIGITLCVADLIVFLVMLAVNCYYEKKE